jgi:hypothetical protein
MAAETATDELLAEDRNWLVRQPGLSVWSAARVRLMQQLRDWVAECAPGLCSAAGPLPHAQAADYQRALWACWSYHWQGAIAANGGSRVDGWEVARALRAGRGLRGRGNLGGDVVQDVVLARALLHREEKAIRHLEKTYLPSLLRQVGQGRTPAAEPPDWWWDLLDRLIGITRPPGKLATFAGRCALGPWLVTVTRNFLLALATPAPPPDLPAPEPLVPPELQLICGECLDLLTGVLRQGLATLTPADRALLLMLYGEGLPGREVARLIGIDPGNVSRRKEKALGLLRQCLDEAPEEQTYQECLQLLFGGGGRIDLGHRLMTLLEEAAEGPGHDHT